MITAVDPELERHHRDWIGFTWFIRIMLVVVIFVLSGMALFLT